MQEQIVYAKQQARNARERALLCRDQTLQDDGFKVARLWDDIASEYAVLDRGLEN